MPNETVTDTPDTELHASIDSVQDSSTQSTVDIEAIQNVDSQIIENQEIS
jgi:hypothetical protein